MKIPWHALLVCIALLSCAVDASDRGNSSDSAETSAAHVYVFNRDDDRLRVSLFIDGSLVDSKDVSSENEAEFGTYYLGEGEHSFTITWWDEDTRKSYESSLKTAVKYDTPVTLYTEKNDAPEKFYLTILVKNENERDLDVCLYVDDRFERCTNAKKNSMTEAGKIKLDSGRHNVSVRWKDPETDIEYRKSRSVDLIGDDAVVIYAPKGAAIKKEVRSAGQNAGTTQRVSSQPSQSSREPDVSGNRSENISANAAPGEISALKTTNQAVERNARGQNLTSNGVYIYALVIALAVYLLFRS